MPRPGRRPERREELLPVLASAFAELGYRRATTSSLARRCGVQETVLYRLWKDKKAMFLASIDHVFKSSAAIWAGLLREGGADGGGHRDDTGAGRTPAEAILAHEAEHLGEFGLYRILFAGLGESDDPEIRGRLRRTYLAFQRFVRDRVLDHRRRRPGVTLRVAARRGSHGKDRRALDAERVAWALVGLGTIANIGRELELFPAKDRQRLLTEAGRCLLGEGA